MYALAAGAAGVGVMALAKPVEAKIVYTPANLKLHGVVPLDLNHDGIADFGLCLNSNFGDVSCTLADTGGRSGHKAGPLSPFAYRLWVEPPISEKSKNEIWGHSTFKEQPAAPALRAGFRLGGERKFAAGTRLMATWESSSGHQSYGGPWKNVTDRYLGLKFVIKGKVHYGWARLTVNAADNINATLTGYAYETIPNKSIIAGKTKGPDVTVHSGTLGMLAAGGK